MKQVLPAFLFGVVFAIGLGLGGMTLPQKVIGFLDVTGAWDPALVWVMGGAVSVYAIFYRLVMRRAAPLTGGSFRIPAATKVDRKLLVGAMLFGAGWGLSGYCPAPAITSLVSMQANAWLFTASMLAGMFLFKLWDKKTAPRA